MGAQRCALAVVSIAAACNNAEHNTCIETPNTAPETPSVASPMAERINVSSAGFTIQLTQFADANVGDTHAMTQVEIWQLDGDIPAGRVWTGQRTAEDTHLTSISLSHGAFEHAHDGLRPWTDYSIRARYMDNSESCSAWSPWSAHLRFRTDDGSRYLFDDAVIRDVHIEIPDDSWDAINAEAVPPGCVPHSRSYYAASIVFEDQEFHHVGLRAKGGCGSARNLGGKTAFKVNLSWHDPEWTECRADRRLYGLKRLTLNNAVQDKTLMHEHLGYRLYKRMGVPTPRTAYVRVHVNGEYWGLYLHLETIDRRFLARRFTDNQGMLYEGTYRCDLLSENVPESVSEEDSSCFSRKFKGGPCSESRAGADPTDYSALRHLTQQLDSLADGEFFARIYDFFDFDTFLSSWATDAALGHWDSHEGYINNYRVYHNPTEGRWTLLPTGIDQTFSRDLNPWRVNATLAQRCLDEPECEAAFASRLAQAADTIENMSLRMQAEALYNHIREQVYADVRKPVSNVEFERHAKEMFEWIEARPEQIRSRIEQR